MDLVSDFQLAEVYTVIFFLRPQRVKGARYIINGILSTDRLHYFIYCVTVTIFYGMCGGRVEVGLPSSPSHFQFKKSLPHCCIVSSCVYRLAAEIILTIKKQHLFLKCSQVLK